MTQRSILSDLVRSAHHAADSAHPVTREAVTQIAVRLTANALAPQADVLPGLRVAAQANDGAAHLPGGTRLADPAEAAAGIAAAITATQCDDGLREARGHPGLHAYAAALAVVDAQGGDLASFYKAFHVGWEVGARLGLALGPLRAGVHPHGGWGAAAAAASTAVALGLSDDVVSAAVETALSVALTGPDSTATGGSSSHYLLPALGTSSGIRAALHVAGGGDAPAGAFRHFAQVAHVADARGRGTTSAALTPRPLICDAYLKPLGVCAHALTSWTAVRRVRLPDPENIAEVQVHTYGAAAQLAQRQPRTLLARRFSIPWAVGCAAWGSDVAADDVRVGAVAAVTGVIHTAIFDSDYPASRPAAIRIRMKDGRVFEEFARFHPGDREQPLSAEAERSVLARLVRCSSLLASIDELATPDRSRPLRELTSAWLNCHATTSHEELGTH